MQVVVLPLLALLAAQGVSGQFGFNLGNLDLGGLLSGVGDMLSFQAGGGGYGFNQPETCPAFQLPSRFGGSYQEFCRYLAELDDQEIENMFKNGRGPQPGEAFPLKGCVLGCLIGKDGARTGYMWGSGSWSGKCVRGNSVMNLITPLPSLGGIMTVMDTFDWEDGIWVQERFPGKIRTDWSWAEAYSGRFPTTGASSNVWVLEYPDVQVDESIGDEGNPMADLQNTYAKLVQGSRDEVRMVEPGLMFGKLFRRPNSYLNPLPVGVDRYVLEIARLLPKLLTLDCYKSLTHGRSSARQWN